MHLPCSAYRTVQYDTSKPRTRTARRVLYPNGPHSNNLKSQGVQHMAKHTRLNAVPHLSLPEGPKSAADKDSKDNNESIASVPQGSRPLEPARPQRQQNHVGKGHSTLLVVCELRRPQRRAAAQGGKAGCEACWASRCIIPPDRYPAPHHCHPSHCVQPVPWQCQQHPEVD